MELLSRDFKNIIRNPLLVKARFFQTTILYIYVGGLFYNNFQNDYTNPKEWQGVTGFFFFISLNSLMIALVPLTITFPQERQIFLKEEGAKLYTVTAYFISRNII